MAACPGTCSFLLCVQLVRYLWHRDRAHIFVLVPRALVLSLVFETNVHDKHNYDHLTDRSINQLTDPPPLVQLHPHSHHAAGQGRRLRAPPACCSRRVAFTMHVL
jgi:hypothetical protein